jgi:hypothetical protein
MLHRFASIQENVATLGHKMPLGLWWEEHEQRVDVNRNILALDRSARQAEGSSSPTFGVQPNGRRSWPGWDAICHWSYKMIGRVPAAGRF